MIQHDLAKLEDGDVCHQNWPKTNATMHGKTIGLCVCVCVYVYTCIYIHRVVHAVALQTLGYLEPVALAQHAEAVVARLEGSNWVGREMVLETLGKLEPASLTQHADAVVEKLNDPFDFAREAALATLLALPLVI